MTEITRSAPFLIADNRALDFLNSVATPSSKEIDWISSGHDLMDWLEQAEMVSAADLKQFRKSDALEACNVVAAKARELREWFRSFVAAHAGRSLEASVFSELGMLNKLLEKGSHYRQIEMPDLPDGKFEKNTLPLRWRQARRWRTPDDLLLPLAEAMGDLICDADFEHVNLCEGPTCTLWFLDTSKNHSRRWCMMSVCGNRAKAAQHRAKRKSVSTKKS